MRVASLLHAISFPPWSAWLSNLSRVNNLWSAACKRRTHSGASVIRQRFDFAAPNIHSFNLYWNRCTDQTRWSVAIWWAGLFLCRVFCSCREFCVLKLLKKKEKKKEMNKYIQITSFTFKGQIPRPEQTGLSDLHWYLAVAPKNTLSQLMFSRFRRPQTLNWWHFWENPPLSFYCLESANIQRLLPPLGRAKYIWFVISHSWLNAKLFIGR